VDGVGDERDGPSPGAAPWDVGTAWDLRLEQAVGRGLAEDAAEDLLEQLADLEERLDPDLCRISPSRRREHRPTPVTFEELTETWRLRTALCGRSSRFDALWAGSEDALRAYHATVQQQGGPDAALDHRPGFAALARRCWTLFGTLCGPEDEATRAALVAEAAHEPPPGAPTGPKAPRSPAATEGRLLWGALARARLAGLPERFVTLHEELRRRVVQELAGRWQDDVTAGRDVTGPSRPGRRTNGPAAVRYGTADAGIVLQVQYEEVRHLLLPGEDADLVAAARRVVEPAEAPYVPLSFDPGGSDAVGDGSNWATDDENDPAGHMDATDEGYPEVDGVDQLAALTEVLDSRAFRHHMADWEGLGRQGTDVASVADAVRWVAWHRSWLRTVVGRRARPPAGAGAPGDSTPNDRKDQPSRFLDVIMRALRGVDPSKSAGLAKRERALVAWALVQATVEAEQRVGPSRRLRSLRWSAQLALVEQMVTDLNQVTDQGRRNLPNERAAGLVQDGTAAMNQFSPEVVLGDTFTTGRLDLRPEIVGSIWRLWGRTNTSIHNPVAMAGVADAATGLRAANARFGRVLVEAGLDLADHNVDLAIARWTDPPADPTRRRDPRQTTRYKEILRRIDLVREVKAHMEDPAGPATAADGEALATSVERLCGTLTGFITQGTFPRGWSPGNRQTVAEHLAELCGARQAATDQVTTDRTKQGG
jgi:hypothetical protein